MKTVLLMALLGIGNGFSSHFEAIVPLMNSEAGEHTRLVIINPGQEMLTVTWTGYSAGGAVVCEGDFELNGRQRKELDFFSEQASHVDWAVVASDGGLSVMIELMCEETRAAYRPSTDLSRLIQVPHIAKDTRLFETLIGVVNASDEPAQVLVYPKPSGEPVILDLTDPRNQQAITSADLFGQDSDLVDWASLEAQPAVIAGMERFTFLPERDRTAAMGLDSRRSSRLTFVHVAEDVNQFWTGLVLVNAGRETLDVTLTHFDGNGGVLQRSGISMGAGLKHTLLFDAENKLPLGTAWVDAQAGRPDLIGYQLFGSAHRSPHRFFAGLSACTSPGGELVFPVVESSTVEWTGLVALNLGETPADLVFEAINDSGEILARYWEEDVAPGRKIVLTAAGMFGPTVRSVATWIRALSGTDSWVGACLWGDSGHPRRHLSAVIADSRSNLYFPPNDSSEWETIAPEDLGWNTALIPEFLSFLEQQHTRAFIVLKDGRIAIEHYALTDLTGGIFDETSNWYWASAGKTLTATLVGIAQNDGLLNIHQPSSDYLGERWTSLSPQQEERISIRHQLTMTTGLNDHVADSDCTAPDCLVYLADPGTRWAYHNAPYTRLDGVVEAAAGQDFDGFFNAHLRDPIGMDGAWFYLDYNHVYFSTPRSMARFGLLILNRGIWNGHPVLADASYLYDMTHPSQDLNQSYGYLWWLNGQASFMMPGLQYVFTGAMTPNAPPDMFAAIGKNGQLINVVPSQGLVVVRMGDNPDDSAVSIAFQNQLWARLSEIIGSPAAQ